MYGQQAHLLNNKIWYLELLFCKCTGFSLQQHFYGSHLKHIFTLFIGVLLFSARTVCILITLKHFIVEYTSEEKPPPGIYSESDAQKYKVHV